MSVRSVFRSRIGSRSFVGASLPLGAFTLYSCLLLHRPRLLQSFVVASWYQRDVRCGIMTPSLLRFTLHVRQHDYETGENPRVQRTLTPDPYGLRLRILTNATWHSIPTDDTTDTMTFTT